MAHALQQHEEQIYRTIPRTKDTLKKNIWEEIFQNFIGNNFLGWIPTYLIRTEYMRIKGQHIQHLL
jgi:hypothetical protein